ncbi:glycosyl hydrolase family 39 [Edaphobacter bradus]|uniref:glycosyl hydrolase family 39 n=1 Tax=Edaphobacter bradus TaxID=2259016 RepID=UPI0021DFFA4C|nr:glycosyl hydrolase family 39 [Edaphobacter bradus]
MSTSILTPVVLRRVRPLILGFVCIAYQSAAPGQETVKVAVDWGKTTVVSKSSPTLQVVVNPPLRPGEPLGIAAYKAVKELGADYVRYVPWLPYPRLAVAELEPPTLQKTSWDFSLIDPMTKDFLAATDGHPTVMNFSTMPAWLFKSDKPVTYPDDPNKLVWNYTQGTEERDPTDKQIGDYYARLVSWYVNGGFTDENGARHESGYHYKFPVWEVLNEPEGEHRTTPEQYTRRYDTIVSAIHKVSPDTKFMGLALGWANQEPGYFEYFLDAKNHKPGIPLDYISYHFYVVPEPTESANEWQYTFFDQANGFLNTVRYVEEIRKRLSPATKTDLDELGVILPTSKKAGDNVPPPAAYWNLCGSLYAYLYIELSRLQIDLIGMSQLVGYPTQYPSVSMMDWTKNQPNARYWTLKLIRDSFHAGDKLVETSIRSRDVAAQGFVTGGGRKLLLANKRNHAIDVELPEAEKASALAVDAVTGDGPARSVKPTDGKIHMEPFAVAAVSW